MTRFDSLGAWLNWQEQFHPRPIDLGLTRVANVYQQLDINRHKPLTITVGGTNGKGSCVAFLEAIYKARGYKVGAYTSPHILRYNERIRINGQPAADYDICQAFAHIDSIRQNTSLSYFEFGTLAALKLFADTKVDVQLLEVGLGGRLDAVNVVDTDAAVLTTIAIDHVDWLGNTRESIAQEKAGIFRSEVPAIIGDACPPTSLALCAQEKNAVLMQLGQAFSYSRHQHHWDWHSHLGDLLHLPIPAFKGEHQYRNASAVLMAVTTLQNRLPVDQASIAIGLQNAQLNGRFQLIEGKPPVLLDVGHNPQAVQTLYDYLQEAFPGVKIHAVFAMMKDKDICGALAIMRDAVDTRYLAPLTNPRAENEEVLKSYFQQLQIPNVKDGFANAVCAFDAAGSHAQPNDLIVIFGSFFLVSEYLSHTQTR